MNIKTVTFGCRLNALESEKISHMLEQKLDTAIVVNTCAVTAEAERQSAQAVRKISRENPNVQIFVTGCAATRNKDLFNIIPNVTVINNKDKMDLMVYLTSMIKTIKSPSINKLDRTENKLSKQFIQVQNGCNHKCAYCITRLLRGPSVSFPYQDILSDVKTAVENGYTEIVLTGVDTASYVSIEKRKTLFISDVCQQLLSDVPEIRHLRLSSLDPASPEIFKIIDLIKSNNRFMPHLHLSMQSGSDVILKSMHRRHNAELLRNIIKSANTNAQISFSADIICGFPGETDELFKETADLIKELGIIHVHAFPFSARPDTEAFELSNQINRNISKQRVKIIDKIAQANLQSFMKQQINKTVSVLVEECNIGRTPDDIEVKIEGQQIKNKAICNVKLIGIENNIFRGIIS